MSRILVSKGFSCIFGRAFTVIFLVLATVGHGSSQEPKSDTSSDSGKAEASVATDKPAEPKSDPEKKESDNVSALNPSTGAVTFNGFSWNIGDLPALDLRYERFLMENQSMMKDEESYYKMLNQIGVLLTGRPFDSTRQLPQQARYQQSFEILRQIRLNPQWARFDGGCSGQIMDQLESLQVKLRESKDPKGISAKLEESRRNVEMQIRMFKLDPNTQTGAPEQRAKMLAVEEARHAQLEKEKERILAEKAKYEAEAMPGLALAKGQFQVYLFTLIAQRRFQHVITAAKLYQSVIADGDLGMSQKNNPLAKESKLDPDMPLTTTSAAQVASEAQEEVRRSVDAYKNFVGAGMLDAADRTLHQAFLLGEYMPELRGLPIESRMKIFAVRQNRKQMLSALNVLDYAQAEAKLGTLEQLASDFDASATRMQIRTAKMKSDAYLLKAKNALFDGDQAAAESAFREAARIWPTNPAFDDKEKIAGTFDDQMKLKKELDDLIARSDFRAIADRGEKFGAAVHDDPERQKKLREAMKGLNEIERALAKFEEMGKNGSPYAAWEAIDEVAAKYPKDEKVALAYQEATVKASDYIGGVRQAQQSEKQGEDVAALSGYLWALSKNPSSEKVKLSVKTLSGKLLKFGSSN